MSTPHDRPASAGESPTKRRGLDRAEWQLHLLPTMVKVLIAAAVAFLLLGLGATGYVVVRISDAPRLEVAKAIVETSCQSPEMSTSQRQVCAHWKVAVLLEAHVIAQRYHQANVALLVRAWIKYLGFLTGMMISIVGSVFILGRLTEAASKFAAEGSFGSFSVATVSPGLILVTLGTLLMVTTVLVNPPTDVSDAPLYLSPMTGSFVSAAPK